MRKVKLSEVAKIEISGVDKKTIDGETPVKLCNFVDVYRNWAITSRMEDRFMDATAKPNEIARFTIKRGQVAITKDSETRFDIGISTYIADDFEGVILGYHNALITPDPEYLDGKYLNALLHTNYAKTYFAYNASGSGQRYALSVDALNDFPLLLPDIAEQRRIGNLFSKLDRKIELNRQINDNLEAMAKQLYDYWFVQFDFPNEEGKPYKSSGGKMVWNEKLKREIPEGWEILTIKDVCSRIQSGGTPLTSVEEYYNGDISWYRTQELCDKWLFESSIKISEEAVENSSAKWFDANTVVIAIYASPTCGRLGLLANGGTFNQACCGLIPSEKCSKEYLFMWLKENRAKLNTLASGTAQKNLNVDKVKNFEILMPENRNIRLWTKTVETIFGALKSYSFEMEQLTKQRDELLPLLMNGQVSVNYHLSDD